MDKKEARVLAKEAAKAAAELKRNQRWLGEISGVSELDAQDAELLQQLLDEQQKPVSKYSENGEESTRKKIGRPRGSRQKQMPRE